MINELQKNSKVILKSLSKLNGKGLSISDMERELPLKRCEVRGAIAYLLGQEKIEEQIYGKSKVYYKL
jgi:predicted transcriptional regulator